MPRPQLIVHEYRLGLFERILLERAVRALEKSTGTEVPAALSAEIDKLTADAEALRQAQPPQGA